MNDLKDKVGSLPRSPGVYIMKDKSQTVIYVGKAKLLRNRVSQYFTQGAQKTRKTAMLVSHIHDFDIIVTETEFEALVLENSLIKKHKPKYNILLKDDKGYPYIKVTTYKEFPEFSVVPKPGTDGSRYFGPYSSRHVAYGAIDIASKLFKLKDCKRSFPRDIGKQRPCLNAHLGACSVPCDGRISSAEYRSLVNRALAVFEGKFDQLQKGLGEKMLVAAEDLQFELAAQLRDQIKILESLGQKQHIVAGSFADLDVIAYAQGQTRGCAVVLHYIKGTLQDKEYTLLEGENDPSEAISSFIRQYYSLRQTAPKTLLLSDDIEDRDVLSLYLSEIAERKVEIVVPQKGNRKIFVALALENGKQEILRMETAFEREIKSLTMLQEGLGLAALPKRLEAYDISNTAGSETVASMVVFEDAKPKKKDYRRFKIKSIAYGQDDYKAMEEVLTRRIENFIEGQESFSPLPDLFMIDGGLGHVRVAQRVLQHFGLTVPAVGMVKDNRHRTKALVLPDGREFALVTNPVLFSLVGRIQEEVHRFAIAYHRLLRNKKTYASALDTMEGVGEVRKKALLKEFKTMSRIKAATLDELMGVLPKAVAENLYHTLKEEEKNESH